MKNFLLALICLFMVIAAKADPCSPTVHWTGVSDVEFRLVGCQSDYHRCMVSFTVTNHMRKDIELSLLTREIEVYDGTGEKYTSADDTYKNTSLAEDKTGGWSSVTTTIPEGITVPMRIVINHFNDAAKSIQLLRCNIRSSRDGGTQLEVRNLPIPYPCPVVENEAPEVVLPIAIEPQQPVKKLRKPRLRHNITEDQRALWEEIAFVEPNVRVYADHWAKEDSIVVKCTKCYYKAGHWICAFELTNHTLDTLVIKLRDKLPIAVETQDILAHHDYRDCLVYSNEEWDFEPGETFVIPYAVKLDVEEWDDVALNFAKVFIDVPSWRDRAYETIMYGLPITSLE